MANATYRIAMAAGRDAGNRSAAMHGRTVWNEDDWNAAHDTTAKLIGRAVADACERTA